MANAGRSLCLPYKAWASRFIADKPGGNHLQRHSTSKVDVHSFVRHTHRSAPKFERLSLCNVENPVMLEAELGRSVCNGIALGFDRAAQGANWAVCAVV